MWLGTLAVASFLYLPLQRRVARARLNQNSKPIFLVDVHKIHIGTSSPKGAFVLQVDED